MDYQKSNTWIFSKPAKKRITNKEMQSVFEMAEAGNWDAVIAFGLENPAIMDRIIYAYFDSMPDEIKYILPVKWYMAAGKASDAVCNAVKHALTYRPMQWIGKEAVKNGAFDVFCCLRKGGKEEAKQVLSWAVDYGSAYIKAAKINGKVFQGFISKDKIIAYDVFSVEPVIQYGSVYALEQVFPKIHFSALRKGMMLDA